jgi:hypothetical protein
MNRTKRRPLYIVGIGPYANHYIMTYLYVSVYVYVVGIVCIVGKCSL